MPGSPELIYGLNDLPPWPRCVLYGFQWVVILLPIFMIISTIAAESLGLHDRGRVLLLQRLLITSGGIILLQTFLGHRYPLLDGPAAALLLSLVVLAPHGLPTIQGGMLVGGGCLALLSVCGWVRYLESLFTDNVVGVILILVAVTLLPHFAPLIIGVQPVAPQGEPLVFGISVLVMLAIALCNHWLADFPKTISLFLGVLLGTILMGALGRVDLSGVREVAWFALPQPLLPGLPHFSVGAALTFLVAYLAVIINAMGSTYSIGEVVGKEGMAGRVRRGLLITGLGGLVAGIMGGIGTVSYATSPGVVLVTRVGSRYPVAVCGALLIALALFHKALAILVSVPASVVGAATLTGMAAQVGAGVAVLTRSGNVLDGRDYLVIGIPMLMGGIIAILPEAFFAAFPSTVHALLKNGLVVGVVLVLVLEHLLLPQKR
jgi:xanthine/uracil permease